MITILMITKFKIKIIIDQMFKVIIYGFSKVVHISHILIDPFAVAIKF